jgi:hypothetical protein
MKPGNKVQVTDPKSPYAGASGKVVSTATTSQVAAVSVRFNPSEGGGVRRDEHAIWFFRHQLTLT